MEIKSVQFGKYLCIGLIAFTTGFYTNYKSAQYLQEEIRSEYILKEFFLKRQMYWENLDTTRVSYIDKSFPQDFEPYFDGYVPKVIVPKPKDAAKIALAVWEGMGYKRRILLEDFQPLEISLSKDSVWLVKGGKAYILIQRDNGKVLATCISK